MGDVKERMRKKSLQATRVKRINLSWTLFHHQKIRVENCKQKNAATPHYAVCVYKSENGKKATQIYTLSGVSRKHIKKLIGCKFIQNMREREARQEIMWN